MPSDNRLSPSERYERDQLFRHLVDSLYAAIQAANYTPTEIREAAMLAAIRFEERNIRPRQWRVVDWTADSSGEITRTRSNDGIESPSPMSDYPYHY